MPSLLEIMEFSHSSEFESYRKLREMQIRLRTDRSLVLSDDQLLQVARWPEVQAVFERELPELRAVLKGFSDSFKTAMKEYEQAVKDLEKAEKLSVFYKAVLERLTRRYLESLSDMLSEVYRSVYGVEHKQVRLVMDDFRNKKVIKLRIINHQGGKDFVEDFSAEGGAAHVILGLIVAVYFLLSTGGERIIFIDEALSQLHNDSLSRFLKILRQFVDNLGFVFVIVSHDAYRLRGFVDKAYYVEEGVYKEVPAGNLDAFLNSVGEVVS
jgi:DNA repair exonuclease SbcCD ATPase subunit